MLFNASQQVWSLGASLSQTVFAGGLRSAQVAAARAVYDQSVAAYRQTVLGAFQQVEDQLSTLRILAQQAEVQARAIADARRAVAIALNEYQAGTVNYTTVVTAQAILLGDQQTALLIELDRPDRQRCAGARAGRRLGCDQTPPPRSDPPANMVDLST